MNVGPRMVVVLLSLPMVVGLALLAVLMSVVPVIVAPPSDIVTPPSLTVIASVNVEAPVTFRVAYVSATPPMPT